MSGVIKGRQTLILDITTFFILKLSPIALPKKTQTQVLIILLINLSFAYGKSFKIDQILFLTTKYWSHLN